MTCIGPPLQPLYIPAISSRVYVDVVRFPKTKLYKSHNTLTHESELHPKLAELLQGQPFKISAIKYKCTWSAEM